MIIKYPTRKELSEMTTQHLYDLNGFFSKQIDRINAELILRGDY